MPLAPPVMNATLPSSIPMMVVLLMCFVSAGAMPRTRVTQFAEFANALALGVRFVTQPAYFR